MNRLDSPPRFKNNDSEKFLSLSIKHLQQFAKIFFISRRVVQATNSRETAFNRLSHSHLPPTRFLPHRRLGHFLASHYRAGQSEVLAEPPSHQLTFYVLCFKPPFCHYW